MHKRKPKKLDSTASPCLHKRTAFSCVFLALPKLAGLFFEVWA